MRDFVFEGRTKTLLFVLMGVGVISLGATWFSDDPLHMKFWGNWLHNAVFFTGISVVAMFFLSAQITAFAGWNALVRRIWEAESQFVVVGLLLFLPLIAGLFGHFHHLYHWNVEGIADPASPNYDKIIAGKSSFVNKYFYTFATIIVLGAYYWIARRVRQHSIDQDENGTTAFFQYKRIRTLCAIFLPVFGFTSIVLTWQWMMSLDAHWYSTMYGWYSWASLFLAMISFTILLVVYLKHKGYLEQVTGDHFHDLGKYMFGITVFWTYLWFDQYMLIWYANIGEETIYFKERWMQYPVLHGGNLVVNFLLPFLILMRNDTKRKYGTLVFVAILVFIGHWWDYYQMIKPSTRLTVIEHQMHEGHGTTGHSDTKHDEMHVGDALKSVGEAVGHAADQAKDAAGHVAETAKDAAGHAAEKVGEAAHAVAPETTEAVKDAAHAAGQEVKEAAEKVGESAVGQEVKHAAEKAGDMAQTVGHEVKEAAHEIAGHATEAAHGEVAHGDGHDAHGEEPIQLYGKKPFELGWTFPSLLDFGTMLGFLGLFIFIVLSNLEKAALKPKNDPWMEESEHHHVV